MDTKTKKNIAASLRKFATEYSDDDNLRIKHRIRKALLDNEELLYALNVDAEEPDKTIEECYGSNLMGYLAIPETQDTPKNFICYTTKFRELVGDSTRKKLQSVTFFILCDVTTIMDKYTGIERHDLIGTIIKKRFNWSNIFGYQCRVVSDEESATDTNYVSRSIVFEIIQPNSITSKNKVVDNRIRF